MYVCRTYLCIELPGNYGIILYNFVTACSLLYTLHTLYLLLEQHKVRTGTLDFYNMHPKVTKCGVYGM
jgi:hypothetical protein